MEQGTVKWFNDAKSYGVAIADNGDEILCENWHIQSEPKILFEYQRIEFERFEFEGYTRASNIRVIETRDLSMFDYDFITAEEEKVHLSKYMGQVVLVVNTASECGLTHQYQSLQKLYDVYKWKDNGFEILAFPSNQYAQQEKRSNDEILEFVRTNFGVTFTVMQKTFVVENDKVDFDHIDRNSPKREVNGFYKQLAKITGETPQWNFHKYLMSKNGQKILSFDHHTDPLSDDLVNSIEKMLKDRI